MSLKILTVDDSRAVRIIVKKAFRSYDCEVLEASNGVEGLALAAKEQPDIILLDVTMPVMDGIEMLTKLKADPSLKSIPVIMLTAEAGRESVLRIAKLGIRDYIVKPFKEEVLIEKAGRVIDLRPADEKVSKAKRLSDTVDILVVEDKPIIIDQISKGLAHLHWKIHGVSTTGGTIDFCQKQMPDLIIISLSLPEDGAFSLFRILRAQHKTKYVPVFGLAVKTDTELQQKAQQLGFNSIVTKPIDFADLETKVAKAINLDTSERYFTYDEDYLTINLPHNTNSYMLTEVQNYMKGKIADAVDKGFYKVILDAGRLQKIDMETIKLMVQAKEICQDLTLTLILVGNEAVKGECRAYEETRNWTFFNSVDEAKNQPMGGSGAAQPEAAEIEL
ncbi:MAG: response regulator receiver [Puniceicoccaceae bacterium 5H]|nr:MAG: response regulator receiver [Puniceicoccaceae bacterium 5H]